MRPPRSKILVGAAVPVLLLVGLGWWTAEAAETPGRPIPGTAVDGPDRPVGRASGHAEAAALDLLRRSARAEGVVPFTGTQVLTARTAGGTTSHVVSVRQGADGVRRTTAADPGAADPGAADPATDDPSTVDPGAVDERAGTPSGLALAALVDAYDLRVAGHEPVAGRATTVVAASRTGAERARLWIDDATGLLLRQEVRAPDGRLTRTASFLDVRPGRAPSSAVGAAATSPLTVLAGWRARGWPCPGRLAGGFALLDARSAGTAQGPVLHLTYGDGLSAVSVFVQHGRLGEEVAAGWHIRSWGAGEVRVREEGADRPELLAWQSGDVVITAVGDADPATLRTALAALPRQRAAGGALAGIRGAIAGVTTRLAAVTTHLPG